MISKIAQQTLIWSLIVFILIWGYIPSLWNMEWPALTMLGLALVSLLTWGVVSLANLKTFLAKRSSQFGISLAVSAISMLGILVAVNYAANLYNQKKDITSNQLYTLSSQSKKVAKELKENIDVEVWTTSIQRMTPNQDLQKFLENYRIESGGKIKILVKNPNEDLTVKERGISKDNVILFRASSGRESRIENVNEEKIEEQVTNAIVQAVKGIKKTLCFTTEHGELDLNDTDKTGLSQIKQTLQNSSYQTQVISVTNAPEIPPTCEAVVIAGPKGEPTDSGLGLLKKYLQGGGKALVMLGATSPQKWNELIKPYGVELRNDIVLDLRVQPPTAVATQNFFKNVEIVKSFDRMVVLFQSSSLSVPTSGKVNNFDVKTFVSSEPHTFAKKKSSSGAISTTPSASDQRGPLALAVLVEDPNAQPKEAKDNAESIPGLDEHDHGHGEEGHDHGMIWDLIAPSKAYAQNASTTTPQTTKQSTNDTPAASETKLIVIGNDLFASNTFVNQLGNLDLFMNSVSYLLEDKDVIGIRPRDLKATRLQLSPETDRNVQATVYLLAVLCFLGAMAAASRRKKMSP